MIAHIQDYRNARTLAAANSVRIQIRLAAGDQEGADAIVDETRDHLQSLGMTQEQMHAVLTNP